MPVCQFPPHLCILHFDVAHSGELRPSSRLPSDRSVSTLLFILQLGGFIQGHIPHVHTTKQQNKSGQQ